MRASAPALAAVAAAITLISAAPALAADPAQPPITKFDDTLLAVMKDGKSLGFQGRYAQLKPVVEKTLDLRTMTATAVGPTWTGLSESQKQGLVAAFTRLTVASYAHNFDGFSGQKFAMDPNVITRPSRTADGRTIEDKIVQTHLIQKNGESANLAYRMRQTSDGSWKVIDIYYNGAISQLTTSRSDFAATLASGGPKALTEKLNAQADKLSH